MEPKMEMMIGVRQSKSVLEVNGQNKLNIIARWELPKEEMMEMIDALRKAAEDHALKKVEEIKECQNSEECLPND